MVDAAYDELYRAMKPGMRENECVGLVNKVLYDLGSEYVEGVNAISGERCSPHPHVFSDRMLRPGDPGVLRHPPLLHGLSHLLLPDLRDRLRVARAGRRLQALPRLPRCGDRADPARRDDGGDRVRVAEGARSSGFPNEEAAFALQYGHGIGLAIWEKPIISRLVSLEHPRDQAGHGVRARDVLAVDRRLDAPRASKRKSSSRPPDTRSSRASRPRSSWSRARATSRSAVRSRRRARRSRTSTATGSRPAALPRATSAAPA